LWGKEALFTQGLSTPWQEENKGRESPDRKNSGEENRDSPTHGKMREGPFAIRRGASSGRKKRKKPTLALRETSRRLCGLEHARRGNESRSKGERVRVIRRGEKGGLYSC